MTTNNVVPIENFDIVTSNVATAFSVDVIMLTLFVSADLRVTIYDANQNIIQCSVLTISGDAYTNWSSNDEYINTYVANYYGFTLIPTSTKNATAGV
jgi:hypothetical protein